MRADGLCLLPGLFLDGHTGFDRANPPGWLDLFSVMTSPPAGKMEEAAMVLDRAIAFPNTLRYRDFCRGNSSSGGRGLSRIPTLCKRGLGNSVPRLSVALEEELHVIKKKMKLSTLRLYYDIPRLIEVFRFSELSLNPCKVFDVNGAKCQRLRSGVVG